MPTDLPSHPIVVRVGERELEKVPWPWVGSTIEANAALQRRLNCVARPDRLLTVKHHAPSAPPGCATHNSGAPPPLRALESRVPVMASVSLPAWHHTTLPSIRVWAEQDERYRRLAVAPGQPTPVGPDGLCGRDAERCAQHTHQGRSSLWPARQQNRLGGHVQRPWGWVL